MDILIVYATSQGHTRNIARAVAETCLDQGASVELLPAADADDLDLSRYRGVVLAASIHAGHYQKTLSGFADANSDALNDAPSLFLSVCLAAAGHDAEDWRKLDEIAADLSHATGWTPTKTIHVPGAYLPSQYDIVSRFVMRRIIAAKDPAADLDADKVYTDWVELRAEVQDWLSSLPTKG